MEKKPWFSEWFDTDYYHTLYKSRSEEEATQFISNLKEYLALPKSARVLDLACGKGRHSKTLNQLGYEVLGADLSPNSIEKAALMANDSLSFIVHDMREVIQNEQFTAVFNLFTSFGYFDSTTDNEKVLLSVNEMLKEEGFLVVDFMNATKVINNLVLAEDKTIDGIDFKIKRNFDGTHIFKNIDFEADGGVHSYMERVQALTLSDFQQLFDTTGFELIRTFGDFDLSEFEENTSNRLIMIVKK